MTMHNRLCALLSVYASIIVFSPLLCSPMLTTSLVKCLRAVADTCHSLVLETAFPGQLFASLVQLLLIREPSTQLDVALLWHRLVDHHANKDKIPLNTCVCVCVCACVRAHMLCSVGVLDFICQLYRSILS